MKDCSSRWCFDEKDGGCGGWALLEVLEVIRCMVVGMLEADSLFAGGAGSDALCAALYAGD